MISVIMPTMWVGQRYKEMLPVFESHPLIGEVILIDNDTSKTDKDVFAYSKLVYVPQKENIYVNPAWNLGANIAKYDILCFANDDIEVDLGFLDKVLEYITPEFGMLGLGSGSIVHTQKPLEVGGSTITPIDTLIPYYATFFFIHSKSYCTIPEEMKIYYGDTYLFEKNKKFNRKNHQLVDGRAITYLGTSSRLFKKILDDDYYIYRDIII